MVPIIWIIYCKGVYGINKEEEGSIIENIKEQGQYEICVPYVGH